MRTSTLILLLLAFAVPFASCTTSEQPITKENVSPTNTTPTASAPTTSPTSTTPPAASSSQPPEQPPSPVCNSAAPGPRQIALTTPTGVSYCIDSTEVTQAHFAAFLAKAEQFKPSWPEFCADTKLEAPAPWEDDKPGNCGQFYTPEQQPNKPMGCVTWCQAYAYCQWAGKQLCGKPEGGTVPTDAGEDATQSAWFNACSSWGKTKYPYGDEFVPGRCTDEEWLKKNHGEGPYDNLDLIPDVGSSQECHGTEAPFSEVIDLSGSVVEFEDNLASKGGVTGVRIRGGSMLTKEKACADVAYVDPRIPIASVGFRCCAKAE